MGEKGNIGKQDKTGEIVGKQQKTQEKKRKNIGKHRKTGKKQGESQVNSREQENRKTGKR